MRVFVAGGTGVIGRPLVGRLLARSHGVGVLARSEAAASAVTAMGAEPIEGDAFNSRSLHYAVKTYRPEVIVNQLTALPRSLLNVRKGLRAAKATNQLRAEAGPALVAAAAEEGVERLISQSIAFAQLPGPGIRVESDPLYVEAPGAHGAVVGAVKTLESVTLETAGVSGVVLRYGALYGPGTYFAAGEAYPDMLRRRLLPVIGEGRGTWGLLHVDDAVDATIKAFDAPPGVYNVCDDAPIVAADLLHWMAYALGAKRPRTVSPRWFSLGPGVIARYLIDEQPEVSTDKAARVLGWSPRHPDWRHELARVLRGE